MGLKVIERPNNGAWWEEGLMCAAEWKLNKRLIRKKAISKQSILVRELNHMEVQFERKCESEEP